MDSGQYQKVKEAAFRIRSHIITTIVNNGEGHGGPALSCADIVAVLFFACMKKNDRFLLSAGHKCLALYGALVENGTVDRSVLDTYNRLYSPVPGHPDMNKLPGVDFSTGSLGPGLGIACGFAKAAKLRGTDDRVYVLMGDGEQTEGSVWESAALAAHHGLGNIVAFVDRNGLQVSGSTGDVLNMEDLAEKYRSFGWDAACVDGHDIEALCDAVSGAGQSGRPTVFICDCVKGKGLPFAEGNYHYHHWDPDQAEKDAAMEALRSQAQEEGWTL